MPERREAVEIVETAIVSRPDQLIEPAVADAVDCGFYPAPHFERRSHTAPTEISRRETPASLAYSVSACATTWSML